MIYGPEALEVRVGEKVEFRRIDSFRDRFRGGGKRLTVDVRIS